MIPRNALRVLRQAVGWVLLAVLLYRVGTFLAIPVLRSAGLRAEGDAPDWVDSAAGITLILLAAGSSLALRLRLFRQRRPSFHARTEPR